jgi:hypothetical protein
MRSAVIAVLVAGLSMAAAPAASAATVGVEDGVLLVSAAPSEQNDISFLVTGAGQYKVEDIGAAPTPGPGCSRSPDPAAASYQVVCPAAGVHSVVTHLGDGDDSAGADEARIPITTYGEAGNDRIWVGTFKGSLADGGDGDDRIEGAYDASGGPGNDFITGSRLLDGGDGNDVVEKGVDPAAGRVSGGAGDDQLSSKDGVADEIQCGDGQDAVIRADTADRDDGSCESRAANAGDGPTAPLGPQITVFEAPKGRLHPDRKGRLAMWMKCSVPVCDATVRFLYVGDGPKPHRFRKRPAFRVRVGEKAKLFHLRLTGEQRRALSRVEPYTSMGAVVVTRGSDVVQLMEPGFCSRADPCDGAPARRTIDLPLRNRRSK